MSERFCIKNSSMNDDFGDPLCHWFEDNGAEMSDQTVCDLLNRQAEQLEVLRETVKAYVPNEIIAFWREVADGNCPVYDDIKEEVKARIAALEGK